MCHYSVLSDVDEIEVHSWYCAVAVGGKCPLPVVDVAWVSYCYLGGAFWSTNTSVDCVSSVGHAVDVEITGWLTAEYVVCEACGD